jgi:O-antigen/teichoic acid export membrane protein
LGYQFSQGLSVAIEGANQAWSPFFFRREAANPGSREVVQVATYFVMLASGSCMLGALMIGPALRILTPPLYWGARPIAVCVALGFCTLAPYYVSASAIMYSRRVVGMPVITFVASAINVAFNFWLLPRFGIQAAAFNTAAGYCVLALLNTLLARRVHRIEQEYGIWLGALTCAVLIGIAGQSIQTQNPWLEALLRLPLAALWSVLMLPLGLSKLVQRHPLRS